MNSDMGDGDLVDPAVQGIADDEMVVSSDEEPLTIPSSGDDVPERASEIDDITESIPRPEIVDLSDVEIAALLAERDEYKQLAQRVQADFDNFRRRSIAQAQADADRATGRLAGALLPVLDAAEAAYLNHPDEVGPFRSLALL